ncbi:SDR family NAD(P)-dependent oxidoreductase [Jiella mangrovi]|uniref:SDR family NAD(P)-dependent oxidoreductase n=1 Tax=Jiella mangrovi TaxID=2821407 RepID=A0ABS4BCR0_9HYPH|nr:SDR family NAD(P)-dependent oxidoreductase [Jiella mangrovi]MBP0614544.1 SDR family NAD(P)-dependent oxidoreductase [Jiella mangrovi]
MSVPIERPPRKDPQAATRPAELPPLNRSRSALGMTAWAARGIFALQVCDACGRVAYPPRDACSGCLSTSLRFQPVEGGATVIAETTIRTSTDLYFRERMPWRVGMVRLDSGASIVTHLHGDVAVPGPVRMVAKLDKGGNAVVIALPAEDSDNMADDLQFRELTASPKFRRVLVTDGRSAVGQAVAARLAGAGAVSVFVGIAEPWKPFAGQSELAAMANVETMELDLTDTASVTELAGEIGGKTDIIVNTADHVRPGGLVGQDALATAHQAFEVNVFGLQRLAMAFGPGMRARGGDGTNSAAAFVDILPIHAFANLPEFGFHSASCAARHSLLQCLRAELRPGGVRVMSVFTGPVDDDWRQHVPPPKVAPSQIASAVLTALNEGIEESFVGDVAQDVMARFLADPKVLERELSQ